MSYMPSPRAPRVPRAQQERNVQWWEWRRKKDQLLAEAFECFNAGDMEGYMAKDAEAKALPEPDIFDG